MIIELLLKKLYQIGYMCNCRFCVTVWTVKMEAFGNDDPLSVMWPIELKWRGLCTAVALDALHLDSVVKDSCQFVHALNCCSLRAVLASQSIFWLAFATLYSCVTCNNNSTTTLLVHWQKTWCLFLNYCHNDLKSQKLKAYQQILCSTRTKAFSVFQCGFWETFGKLKITIVWTGRVFRHKLLFQIDPD